MSRLMETGLDRMKAAQQVAAYLGRGDMPLGDRRSTEAWRTVAAWRNKGVKATKSKFDRFGKFYESFLKIIPPPPLDAREYERYRKDILETLLNTTLRLNAI